MRKDVHIVGDALERIVSEQTETLGYSAVLEFISWEQVAQRLLDENIVFCAVPLKFVKELDPPQAITEPLKIVHELGDRRELLIQGITADGHAMPLFPIEVKPEYLVLPALGKATVFSRIVILA